MRFPTFIAAALAAVFLAPSAFAAEAELDDATKRYIDQQIEKKIQALQLDEEGFIDRVESSFVTLQQRHQQRQQEEEKKRAEQAKNLAKNAAPITDNDHLRGAKDAEFTLLEYSDFECPYCKRFHETAIELLEKHAGKVNWVYRHFPLAFHNPKAQEYGEMSECVAELGGNDAFWVFTDGVYEKTATNGRGVSDADLLALLKAAKVDPKAVQACTDSGKYAQRVKDQMADGSKAGIRGTPGNILIHNPTGRRLVVNGAQPLQALEAAMAQLAQGR